MRKPDHESPHASEGTKLLMAARQRYKEALDHREAWRDQSPDALTPDIVNNLWRSLWAERAAKRKQSLQTIDIPECDRTTEELAALKDMGRGVVLLPAQFTQESGSTQLLINFFPEIYPVVSQKGNYVNQGGYPSCVDVEMQSDSPYRGDPPQGISLEQTAFLTSDNLKPMRLATYRHHTLSCPE